MRLMTEGRIAINASDRHKLKLNPNTLSTVALISYSVEYNVYTSIY